MNLGRLTLLFVMSVCSYVSAQETPGEAVLSPSEARAARSAGKADALKAAKKGDFSYHLRASGPWSAEFRDVLQKSGIKWNWNFCGTSDMMLRKNDPHAFAELATRREAYQETMLLEVKRRFGADIIERMNAEAKRLYDAKPHPTPNPRTHKLFRNLPGD